MISETNFRNLEVLRRAAKNDHLAMVSSTIASSGTKIALIVAMMDAGNGQFSIAPFGHLVHENAVQEDLSLTSAARQKFEQFKSQLVSDKMLAYFSQDTADRVCLSLLPADPEKRTTTVIDPFMIFAWDNPYELYTDPTALDV